MWSEAITSMKRKDDIMALKKKSILLIMAFLIGCFVCACGKEVIRRSIGIIQKKVT